MGLPRALEGYYLATPLFVVVDLVLAAPIRVAALEGTELRWAYYAFAFACGLVCRWRRAWTGLVGMLESSLNIFLLMLAILLPIWEAPGRILAGERVVAPFEEVALANFLVSGVVFVLAFHASRRRLEEVRRHRRAARRAR